MLKTAGAIAAEILDAILFNNLSGLLCIIAILFIRAQHQKYSELQTEIYGRPVQSTREMTEQIIISGLVVGFFASFLTVTAGITLRAETIRYVFYTMCLLFLFDLRYACISYPVGILSAFSLIFGAPDVSIPSLLCLVGILHMVESILVYITRKNDYVPVFIRHKNEITGAFLIRRFWVVPVVSFTYLIQSAQPFMREIPAGTDIASIAPFLEQGAYALGLDCLAAVLCHYDIAITMNPEKKSARSAGILFVYSAVLLGLSYLSLNNKWARYAGVVFCIAAHEGMYLYSRLSELKGEPLYGAAKRGLKVLDFLPGSHAQKMGIKRGDTILSINNNDIQTEEGVAEALRNFPTYTWIQVLGSDGTERTVEYRCYPEGYNSLGIITVPREGEVTYKTRYFEHLSILQNIVNRFRGVDNTA